MNQDIIAHLKFKKLIPTRVESLADQALPYDRDEVYRMTANLP
jgi:hypothetical protein